MGLIYIRQIGCLAAETWLNAPYEGYSAILTGLHQRPIKSRRLQLKSPHNEWRAWNPVAVVDILELDALQHHASVTFGKHRHIIRPALKGLMRFRLTCTDLRIHNHTIDKPQRICTFCGTNRSWPQGRLENELHLVFNAQFTMRL
jgi:hypothetical protein